MGVGVDMVRGGAALDQGCDGQPSNHQHIKPKTLNPYQWPLHVCEAE